MSSIHEQQPEDTRKDLTGAAAIAKIKDLIDEAKSCFFCTHDSVPGSTGCRPMSVQEVDDGGTLWFLSSADSHKNEELESHSEVDLYFQASAHSGFLHLRGRATVSRDRKKIEALWHPIIKTWFTGGVDDPRITVISVKPVDGYYWDNKHGDTIAGVKMLVGAAIGKTLDDSIEGSLRL